jgi:regulator of RNase E activity RraA
MTSYLPHPNIALPIVGPAYDRPDPDLARQLHVVSSATASADLHKLGIRHTFIRGPMTRAPGTKIVGAAVTLQFMPQREDIASGVAQEDIEKRSALWHVLDSVQPGDVLVVAANGDPYTGCLGEMLITYLKGRGGVGAVVDGCIRDWPRVKEIGLPIWANGVTPNYASQAGQFPWAYNVPVACGGVLVLPGDTIIADDDGAVLIPQRVAPLILQKALDHEDWERFSRQRLAEGGSIWTYYPLSDEGRREYEQWRQQQP